MSGCQIPVSMGNKDWRQGLLFCHLANISISFQSITVALWISFYDVMFSRQQYWSGLPYPFPGDLADPGIKPRSPAWEVHSTTEPSFWLLSRYNYRAAPDAQWWRIHPPSRKHGYDPWFGKVPWRRKWQHTPVFLPGKSHGQRSLEGYSPWALKELDTTEQLNNDNCISVRCTALWFELCTSWNDYHGKFSEQPVSHIAMKLKDRKDNFFVIRNVRLYSLNFIYIYYVVLIHLLSS